jgi:hypothetical protein
MDGRFGVNSDIDEVKSGLMSRITCPHCGFGKEEEMPIDFCLFFYECENCKSRLKPLGGDCCVFCSFGTAKCPPRHREQRSD